MISDYETITLATDVQINPVLPGAACWWPTPPPAGRRPTGVPLRRRHRGELRLGRAGQQRLVHHEQRRGQPEGRLRRPVYTLADDGRAIIIGLFNSTWGDLPAAVSWRATGQQVREDAA